MSNKEPETPPIVVTAVNVFVLRQGLLVLGNITIDSTYRINLAGTERVVSTDDDRAQLVSELEEAIAKYDSAQLSRAIRSLFTIKKATEPDDFRDARMFGDFELYRTSEPAHLKSHQDALEELTGEPSRTYAEEGAVDRYVDPGFDYVGEVLDRLQARIDALEKAAAPSTEG